MSIHLCPDCYFFFLYLLIASMKSKDIFHFMPVIGNNRAENTLARIVTWPEKIIGIYKSLFGL